jgi:hypothetical protein
MRMIEDMTLSGLAAGTQATYIDAVRKLAAHYNLPRPPVEQCTAPLQLRGVPRFIGQARDLVGRLRNDLVPAGDGLPIGSSPTAAPILESSMQRAIIAASIGSMSSVPPWPCASSVTGGFS